MKLSKYLADYVEHECGVERHVELAGLQRWIEQGIEAFESTENAKVSICFEDITCEHSFIDADNEGIYGFEVCRFCGWRQYK